MRKLITFATPEYRAAAMRLAHSAAPFFDRIEVFAPRDIPLEFMRANSQLFGFRRGWGYWAWKPYLILKELESMGPTDSLMYCDAQCLFERDPDPLFEAAKLHDGIGLFHQRREGHKNKTYCRGDAFKLMGCDGPKFWDGDNLNSAFSVWTKTQRSIAFVREWLQWNCNYQVVGDEPSVYPNRPEFKAHRHDQSIVSLLAIRDGLFTLRDCSQFGDGYEQGGCDYPRIINHDRRVTAPYLARPTMSSCLEVSTTAACALQCRLCPQDKLSEAYSGPRQMTIELFERCLNNLVPGDAIYFSGFTEPCLAADFMPMLRLSLSRGHRTQIYTTGRGLKLNDAEEVAASDVERITLHLTDSAGHLGGNPANVKILDALAKHRNVQVMAMDNAPHAEIMHLWESLPVHRHAMIDRAGNLDNGLVQVHHRRSGPIKCGAAPALDHSILLPSGELALCCMDYQLVHVVGNLATTPYSEILSAEPLRAIRAAQQNGDDVLCRSCSCAVAA